MMLPRNGNGNSIFPEGYLIVAATLFLTRNMIRQTAIYAAPFSVVCFSGLRAWYGIVVIFFVSSTHKQYSYS